jgi:type II secretory pathway predicted ATPase ExeA
VAAPFPYRDYVAAKAELEQTLKRGPFYGLVAARSGMGKTSLGRDTASALDRHRYQVLYWSASHVSPLSVTRYFAHILHVAPRRSAPETAKVVVDAMRARPAHILAWIDEANRLPVETLAEFRTLAEFEHDAPQAFSVVLCGPPELKTLLDTPALFPIKRRLSLKLSLEGLRREELDAFLTHRFGSTDARRISALHRDEIFERTQATPALLDAVVRHASRLAGRGMVSDQHLREAFDVVGI